MFLGGSNFDLRLKRGFLESILPQVFEIVTYEPRGIGRTEQPDGAWQMTDYAADAEAVLDELGWDSAYVIGESFGGMTALHLAARTPDRILAQALVSTTAGGAGGASADIGAFLDMSREDAARAALLLQDTAFTALEVSRPREFAQKLSERLAFEAAFADPSITSGGYARLLEARRHHNLWEDLACLRVRMWVIAGTRDAQAPVDAQRRMAGRLSGSVFRRYDGGHGLLFSEPGVLRDLLTDWGFADSTGILGGLRA